MSEGVRIERPAREIAFVALDRPEVRNALDLPTRQALAAAFEALADDPDVRVAVLAGSDKVFASGADLKSLATARPADLRRMNLARLWRPIAEFPKPLIAAVRGWALGAGFELALLADLMVAGKGAQFGCPEVKVGIMPGAGATQRLVRLVGRARAMRLLMTGEPIDAATATDWGIVTDLVEDAAVLDRAIALAGSIARLPPLALTQIKEVVDLGADASLSTALALERKSFQLLFDSEDQKEGMRAFLERRTPEFRGE
jgi:enoyl-CoA hydratase/carnithine racemase